MFHRTKILLLTALACVLFGLRVDAVAQSGRLLGAVAYSAPGRIVAAVGVRVVVAGGYSQYETRTDNTGSFALILRPGAYRVVAQGVYPYVQYQTVTGYVSAGANSYINPNPILLVPARRSSNPVPSFPYGQGTDRAVLGIAAHETAAKNNDTGGAGDLCGKVIVRINNRDQDVNDAVIIATPERGYGYWQTRTKGGVFLIKSLKPGKYTITVDSPDYPHYRPEQAVTGRVGAGSQCEVVPNPIRLVPK